MRGPFDIRERIGLPSPSEKSIQNPTVNHILLNPNSEDGCWDVLFMICGGTGVTPMIQLVIIFIKATIFLNYSSTYLFSFKKIFQIEYHLENLKDERTFQLFLLF